MDKNLLRKTEDNLWGVLEDYANGLKSADDVETVKHALSGILKIRCLEEMDGYLNGSFRGGRSGASRNEVYYDDAIHRGSYGRSEGRYSRDGADMRQKLDELMREATDDRQRQIIRDMMNRV